MAGSEVVPTMRALRPINYPKNSMFPLKTMQACGILSTIQHFAFRFNYRNLESFRKSTDIHINA